MLAVMANGQDVTSIEGIANGDKMHPMQEAFHENHGLQYGFCTPGMVMSAIELVTKTHLQANRKYETVSRAISAAVPGTTTL